MRKIFISLVLFFIPFFANANVNFDFTDLRAVITSKNTVEVSKNIILDASQSFIKNNEDISYEWDFGDNTKHEDSVEVVHSYNKAGQYLISLKIKQGEKESVIQKDIYVYENFILLLTDETNNKININNLVDKALESGTYIKVIESYDSTTSFMSEETLSKKLSDEVSLLSDVDSIVVWTSRGSGINALTRLTKERNDILSDLEDKSIVVISDRNLKTVARIIQSNLDIIKAKQIIITRKYELNSLIDSKDITVFIKGLKNSVSEYLIIDANKKHVSILNFISYLVNFMIAQGIPSNTIVLLLMLPVIVTIISFLKQFIGVTTLGVYTPAIITLSFLALGLKFGLMILIIIIITGSILRKILDNMNLLYTPRIAIVLSISTLILLLTLGIGTWLGIQNLSSIAVFPMLIMTTLAEKFVSIQSGKGVYAAAILMLETTTVSLICYWIVEWQYLQNLMLSYPELIILLIVFNVILAKWTGLRFFEYIRFRSIMKHAEE